MKSLCRFFGFNAFSRDPAWSTTVDGTSYTLSDGFTMSFEQTTVLRRELQNRTIWNPLFMTRQGMWDYVGVRRGWS